jgi:hypothetical protein
MSDLLTKETEMEFDAGAVDSIDQSSVEGGGPSYPTIQYHYGNATLKKVGGMDYQGGFVIKDGAVSAELLTAAGWTKTAWAHDTGTEDDVWWKREIAVAVIAQRKRWEVAAETGPRKVFPWNAFDKAKEAGRPSGRTHFLVLVKGLEEAGPIVLTLKGVAGRAFEDYRDSKSVITKFSNTVIRAANSASDAAAKKAGKAAGKKWAYRAFWLPTGAARDDKGEPVFTEVGSGKDTKKCCLPIALGLPDKPEQVDLKRFYVGNDLLAFVNALYDSSVEWRTAWENIKPGTTEGNGEAAAVEERTEKDAEDAVLAATGL